MRQERSPFVAIELVVTQTPDSTGNSGDTLRFPLRLYRALDSEPGRIQGRQEQ